MSGNIAERVHNVEAAQTVAKLLIEPSHATEVRARGFAWLATLDLARGRWNAARDRLQTATELEPIRALVVRSYLATTPFLPTSNVELRTLRERLLEMRGPMQNWADDTGVPGPWVRLYLVGLLSARLGDEDSALAAAEDLAGLPEQPELGSLQTDLAATIRAYNHWTQSRPEPALATLEAMAMEVPLSPLIFSYVGSLSHPLMLRAELLRAVGRTEEALRWYAAPPMDGYAHVLNLAPAHLGMARIYDARGERDKAARHYARFVELWADADRMLQPRVEEARRRLARLTADEG